MKNILSNKTVLIFGSVAVALTLILGAIYVSSGSFVSSTRSDTTKNLFGAVANDFAHTPQYVSIKYRTGSVDIAHPRFERLDTSRSSFVRGAWYDAANRYMIINLNGTYYHYCAMPQSAWNSFRLASSFGQHYNASIKGRYDCRINPVPQYNL